MTAVLLALTTILLESLSAVNAGMYSPERLISTSIVFTLYLSPFCGQFLLGCLIAELYRNRTIV